MIWRTRIVLAALVLLLGACASRERKTIENLEGAADVSRFALTGMEGVRDGDRFAVQVRLDDPPRSVRLDLRFRVGVPTRLESGTWSGLESNGSVRERSSTFLGGQSGPPSVGGSFELLAPGGKALYRVNIPVREVPRK